MKKPAASKRKNIASFFPYNIIQVLQVDLV